MHEIGDILYVSNDIIVEACEDHPNLVIAKVGEKVEVIGVIAGNRYNLKKENGYTFTAKNEDLMFTKPTWETKVTWRDFV